MKDHETLDAHRTGDLMDDLFDSIDLLEEVELGDIDLSVCHADGYFETSDSDSGISVSCENSANKAGSCNTVFRSLDSDCVLTDAVGSVRNHETPDIRAQTSFTPLNSPVLIQPSGNPGVPPKPIKIVKVSSNAFSVCSNTSEKAVRKVIPIHSIKPMQKTNVFAPHQSAMVIQPIRSSDGAAGTVEMPHKSSPAFGDETGFRTSSTSPAADFRNSIGDGAFLDKYDPTTHTDLSLEMHLRDFCGATFTNHDYKETQGMQTAGFRSTSSSLASPPYVMSSGNCFLSHASLDRIRKKQERMIKNRQAASMSRLRKKEYLERLEMRYEQLKRENLSLWRQNEEWRVRCQSLESSLNELQTQINILSPCDVQLDQCNSSSIHQSLQVQTSDDSYSPSTAIHSSTERLGLSNLPPRLNRLSNLTASGPLNNQGSTDVPSGSDWRHKPAPNPTYYSAKDVTNSRHLNRNGLVSLTGIVNRHRPVHQLNSSRPKLIATTSLLGIFCLFTLNVILPPFSFTAHLDQRLSPGRANLMSAHSLQSVAHRAVGQRTLLSMPVDEPVVTNASDDLDRLLNPCTPDSDSASDVIRPSPMENGSFGASGHAWQQWVMQNNRVNTESTGNAASQFTVPRETTVAGAQHSHSESLQQSEFDDSDIRARRVPLHRGRRLVPKVIATSKTATDATDKGFAAHSDAGERGLQPFYLQPHGNWDELLDAVGRRKDTIYLILARLDSIYLHALDPIYVKLATKITLIVPTHSTPNGTKGTPETDHTQLRRTMLQVECELRNVTLIHPPGRPETRP